MASTQASSGFSPYIPFAREERSRLGGQPVPSPQAASGFSPYISVAREEWSRLRGNTPLTLSEEDLAALRSAEEYVSMEEVADIYLPLSRLLNLYVAAAQQLHRVTDTFLGPPAAPLPAVSAGAG